MKKYFLLLFVSVIIVSCGNTMSDADLEKINGYWEIETAIMPDGSKKEYTVNPTIDFFELKGKTGFRKKVMPQFDGKYLVNELSENIKVSHEDGKTYLNYTTEFAKWKEEILELDSEHLVVRNAHDMEYHYKKPEPFSVK